MSRIAFATRLSGLAAVVLVGLAGCQREGSGDQDQSGMEQAPVEVMVDSVGLLTPESVLYDSTAGIYLVSNINGSPVAVDSNGFISRLNPDGSIAELKWIDGAADGVRLDGPKGLAIVGDVLYVSDITVVRKFDRNTGAPMGEIAVPGSTFLNDLAAGPDGSVYVTDSGLEVTADGIGPDGSDGVYRITPAGELETLVKNDGLGNPNGVTWLDDGLWVVTFGSGELYRVADGMAQDRIKLPTGQLDGVVALADGTLLISSWEGQDVYRGPPTGPFTEVTAGLESPADIGYDPGRHRIMIPLFLHDAVAFRGVGM